jgi:hypothetical protein
VVMTGSVKRVLICLLRDAEILVVCVFEHKERPGTTCDDFLPVI